MGVSQFILRSLAYTNNRHTQTRRHARSIRQRRLRSPHQPSRDLRKLRLPRFPMAEVPHLRTIPGPRCHVRCSNRLRQLQVSDRCFRGRSPYPHCTRLLNNRYSGHILYIPSRLHEQDGTILLRVPSQRHPNVHDLRPERRRQSRRWPSHALGTLLRHFRHRRLLRLGDWICNQSCQRLWPTTCLLHVRIWT